MEQATEKELNMQRWLTAAYNHMLQSLYAIHNALALYEPQVAEPEQEAKEEQVVPFTVIKGDQDIEG